MGPLFTKRVLCCNKEDLKLATDTRRWLGKCSVVIIQRGGICRPLLVIRKKAALRHCHTSDPEGNRFVRKIRFIMRKLIFYLLSSSVSLTTAAFCVNHDDSRSFSGRVRKTHQLCRGVSPCSLTGCRCWQTAHSVTTLHPKHNRKCDWTCVNCCNNMRHVQTRDLRSVFACVPITWVETCIYQQQVGRLHGKFTI